MFFRKKTIEAMVKSGDVKRLASVLAEQAVGDADEKGITPLQYAVQYEKSKVARMLLGMGAPIGKSDDEAASLLEQVARTCNENVWKAFVEHGHHLPATIDGEPLLHWLVTQKYYAKDLLDVLLATGVDINALNSRGMTALAFLLGRETFSLKALDHLLEAGIDVNYAAEPRATPLIMALENRELPCTSSLGSWNFERVLSRLCAHGLDLLNIRKPLATGSSISLAVQALQAGNSDRFIALFRAGIAFSDDDIRQVKGFLRKDCFDEKQRRQLVRVNEERGNVLPVPVDFYDKATLRKMVKNADGTDASIEMVRQIAMSGEYFTREKILFITPLLDRGVDLNAPVEHGMREMTLLCAVVGWSDMLKEPEALVQWLLERGARIEAHGHSALLYAVWFNKRKMVTLLVDRGADLDFVDKHGLSFESMIMTPSPRGDLFPSDDEVFAMFAHIADLYRMQGKPFPVDRRVLSGNSPQELTSNMLFMCTIVAYHGHHQRRLLKLYVDNGWDINRKFELVYADGTAGYLTFFDFMMSCCDPDQIDFVFYLDTYPHLKCGTADYESADSLRLALLKKHSVDVIKRIIARTENIQRTFTRKFKDDVYTHRVENYLSLALDWGHRRNPDVRVEETLQIFKALIEAGCDVEYIVKSRLIDQYKNTGLYRNEDSVLEHVMDVWSGDLPALSLIEVLLDAGAPVHTRLGYFGEAFVHKICGRIKNQYYPFVIGVLEILEKRGLLEIEEASDNGATALLHAAGSSNPHVTKWLVERGANVMAIGGFDDSTALNRNITNFAYHSKQDRLETTRILLDAGADINYADNDGYTPLMCAVHFGCLEVARELVDRGADLSLVHGISGKTLIHLALDMQDQYDLSERGAPQYTSVDVDELRKNMISLLVENGVDINAPQDGGTTPLNHVIVSNDVEMFKFLTARGADSNRVDFSGRTAAMFACMRGGFGFVNTIFRRKKTADVIANTDNDGLNVIHYAARRFVDERDDMLAANFIQQFVQKFDVPLVANCDGVTPLHYACIDGKSKTVEKLLELGSDINAKDNSGNTPLHYAAEVTYETDLNERYAFVRMLLEQGADHSAQNEKGYTAADYARMCIDEVDNVDGLKALIALLDAEYVSARIQ